MLSRSSSSQRKSARIKPAREGGNGIESVSEQVLRHGGEDGRGVSDPFRTEGLPYITVKEICAAAGVNRSTYYLHYETIDDLLMESAQYLTRQFLESMECPSDDIMARLSTCPLEELYLLTPQYLKPYLRYIQDHSRLFRTAMENSQALDLDGTYGRMFRHVFAPILERFGVAEKDRPYYMSFFVHGLIAIILEWLERDCDDSIDRIIEIMQGCVRPTHIQ